MHQRTRARLGLATTALLLAGGLGACSDEDGNGSTVNEEIDSVQSTITSVANDAGPTASSIVKQGGSTASSLVDKADKKLDKDK